MLFLALGASRWVFVTGFALAALWDVYHTSMQNFGFCRITTLRPATTRNLGDSSTSG